MLIVVLKTVLLCILYYRNLFKWNLFILVMLKIKRLTDVVGHKVYTDAGDLFGVIEEVNLVDNKVDGWRIVVSRDSSMMGLLGGARGIIVPHQFIKAIGDIILISKAAVPVQQAAGEDLPMDDAGEDIL